MVVSFDLLIVADMATELRAVRPEGGAKAAAAAARTTRRQSMVFG